MTVTQVGALSEDDVTAISIHISGEDQRHTGILYRDDEGNFRHLHLAFHYDLRDEEADPAFTCTKMSVEKKVQDFLSTVCAHVAREEPKIPYGVSTEGTCFDEAGNFIEPPVGRGLTCATFITHLLRGVSLQLLAEETWPERPSDAEWRRRIEDVMEANKERLNIPQEHIDAVRASPMAFRIRPEEVAAAVTRDPWPVSFEDIEALATDILAELDP